MKLAPWLHYGTLVDDAAAAKQAAKHLKHMRRHWTCAVCGTKLVATKPEIDAHAGECRDAQRADEVRDAAALPLQEASEC